MVYRQYLLAIMLASTFAVIAAAPMNVGLQSRGVTHLFIRQDNGSSSSSGGDGSGTGSSSSPVGSGAGTGGSSSSGGNGSTDTGNSPSSDGPARRPRDILHLLNRQDSSSNGGDTGGDSSSNGGDNGGDTSSDSGIDFGHVRHRRHAGVEFGLDNLD